VRTTNEENEDRQAWVHCCLLAADCYLLSRVRNTTSPTFSPAASSRRILVARRCSSRACAVAFRLLCPAVLYSAPAHSQKGGPVIGAIAGDITGSVYESRFRRIQSKTFPLFHPEGRFTGDSVLTVAVARASPGTPARGIRERVSRVALFRRPAAACMGEGHLSTQRPPPCQPRQSCKEHRTEYRNTRRSPAKYAGWSTDSGDAGRSSENAEILLMSSALSAASAVKSSARRPSSPSWTRPRGRMCCATPSRSAATGYVCIVAISGV
jgi:hypothetical protein